MNNTEILENVNTQRKISYCSNLKYFHHCRIQGLTGYNNNVIYL